MLPIVGRVKHGARLLRGIWLVLAIPYGFFGLLTLIRDNFLPVQTRAAWDTLGLLPHWPASWWIAAGLLLCLIGLFEASFREDRKLRSAQTEPIGALRVSGAPDPGMVAVQGWMDLAREALSRAQMLEGRTLEAEHEKTELRTRLAIDAASAAELSRSVTPLIASNQELSRLVRDNLALAEDISTMRNQAEERFRAAMHTVGNMYLRLAEAQPESITTEERANRAVVYAQEFFDALAFYLNRPVPRPGRSDEEAEGRFRAIRPVQSLKPPVRF